MLLAIDLHEDLIDEEGITITSVFAFQSTCINGSEFDTPQADRLAGYIDASLGEQVFNITMAEIEAVVQPDGVGNYIWQKSVTLVNIHGPSLPISSS